MVNNFFKFHSSCVSVKGVNIGNIYDLCRGNLYSLPNSILDLFEEYSSKGLSKLMDDYDEQKEIINNYLDFFLENELIFFTNNLENFPTISTIFNKAYLIDTILMEIDNFDKTKNSLFENDIISEIGCSEIVLISSENSIENLKKVLMILDKSKVQTVTYLMNYNYFNEKDLTYLGNNYFRLNSVFIYNCPKNIKNKENSSFIYTKNSLEKLLNLKISSINDLVPNIDSFVESQNYNLFYNRKVYIDNENNIKHSNNDNIFYGNLEKTTIDEVLFKSDFKKLWNITKDQINVCKDCELRYICPDNRIPEMINENEYFHKTACNYNPYTNEWK